MLLHCALVADKKQTPPPQKPLKTLSEGVEEIDISYLQALLYKKLSEIPPLIFIWGIKLHKASLRLWSFDSELRVTLN